MNFNKHTPYIFLSLLFFVLVLAILFSFSHNKQERVQNVSRIEIGSVLSLSGMAASDGESIKEGIELAKRELAKQNIHIAVNYLDDRSETKETVSSAKLLCEQKPDAAIAFTWGFLVDAGYPVLNKCGITFISPANTSEFAKAGETGFFGATKVEKAKDVIKQYLIQKNAKTVSFVGNQGAWGDTNANIVKQSAQELGIIVNSVDLIAFGKEGDTIPSLVTKLSKKPTDVLFVSLYDEKALVNFFDKVRQFGMKSDIVATTSSIAPLVESGRINSINKDRFVTLSTKRSDEFTKKFQQYYGKLPNAYADNAYDSVMLLVKVIQEKPKNMSLAMYLESKEFMYSGFAKEYAFDINHDVSGGQWVLEKVK